MSERVWGIASYVLVSIAALAAASYIAWRCGVDGSTIAAWVQAVGSIGAIVGSFVLGRQQAKNTLSQAMQMAALEKSARRSSILAVVRMAYAQAEGVAEHFAQKSLKEAYDYWTGVGHAEVRSALSAMDACPLFELDSATLVAAAYGIKSALLRIEGDARLMAENFQPWTAAQLLRVQGGIAAEGLVARNHWVKIAGELAHDGSASVGALVPPKE